MNDGNSGTGADNSDGGKVAVLPTVAAVRDRLRSFLEANPKSAVEEIQHPPGKMIAVTKPWGDESLAILIPADLGPLEAALNNLRLPERYTGVWHTDTKDFELIWTANALQTVWNEVGGRTFRFKRGGREYECTFGRSSERVLAIAANFVPITSGPTSFRNLSSFRAYATWDEKKRGPIPAAIEPRSFWIKNIEWDEDDVLDLIYHLNFYLTYFDTRSPTILVHTPLSETEPAQPQTRYTAGTFPAVIDSKPLDDNLLQLWFASRAGDSARRFLYGFRVIEYASYSYLAVC